MRHRLWPFLLLLCLPQIRAARAVDATQNEKESPIVALFEMEDRGSGLSAESLNNLTLYLAARLTEGGYQLIPRDQIRARLLEVKKGSFQSCYDQSCQVELGRELAAQKTISTQVIKMADGCKVTATIFDLRKSTGEMAATGGGPCDEKGLISVIDQIAADLCRPLGGINFKTGYLTIRTEPAGAVVAINGVPKGSSPLTLELDSGMYPVNAHLEGHQDALDQAVVSPGRTATVSMHLRRIVPTNPMDAWGHALFWSGLGLAAVGAGSTVMMTLAQDDYRNGEWGADSRIKTWSSVMLAGYGVGGALMITGVVLWILSPPEEAWRQTWIRQNPMVSLQGSDTSFGISLSGRW